MENIITKLKTMKFLADGHHDITFRLHLAWLFIWLMLFCLHNYSCAIEITGKIKLELFLNSTLYQHAVIAARMLLSDFSEEPLYKYSATSYCRKIR